MYAADPAAAGRPGAVSCRDLDPIGFLQAYYPANLIVNCEAECPMKWMRMPRSEMTASICCGLQCVLRGSVCARVKRTGCENGYVCL